MPEPSYPPDLLRSFLDAGGDPTTLDRWKCLVDNAQLVIGDGAPDHLEAESWREVAETAHEHEGWNLVAAHFARVAEMYDDPALAHRLIESLPPGLRETALLEVDQARRPHPISVEIPVMDEPMPGTEKKTWYLGWRCNNCGEAHKVGDGVPVVAIGYRPGWSTLDDDAALTFCAGCITIAAEIANGCRVPTG